MLASSSPQNLRVFEVLSSKNLNPFCLKNLKTFTLSLRNAALILTSVFEGFRGLTSNENFRGSSKYLKFLSKFYNNFHAFLVNFLRFFEDFSKKPQKSWPHPHLRFWGFLRVDHQKPQKFCTTLSLKKPSKLLKT